jgi:hypothetical protein
LPLKFCFYNIFSLQFKRKNTGSINGKNHALSNTNYAVSASNVNGSDTAGPSSSYHDSVKESQNPSKKSVIEENSENWGNPQFGGIDVRLNSVSHQTKM